jgi:hypothetical protein
MTTARGRVCSHCGLWHQFGFFPAACGGSTDVIVPAGAVPDDPRHNTVQPKARHNKAKSKSLPSARSRVRCVECNELVERDRARYDPGEKRMIDGELRTLPGGWCCNDCAEIDGEFDGGIDGYDLAMFDHDEMLRD